MNFAINTSANCIRDLEFRNKFIKQIQSLSEETQEGLKRVAIRFVNDENDEKCLEILWRMTYDPETALNMLGISIENDAVLDDEAEKNIQIPYTLAINFRNELRNQRKKVHPEFMEIEITDGCKEAYESFLKATADPILTTATCYHCNKVYSDFTEEELSRILFLLESSNEANYFGGIRSLKFGYAQTVCLKKYAYQIHDYLESLWYEYESKEHDNSQMPQPLMEYQDAQEENTEEYSELDSTLDTVDSLGKEWSTSRETVTTKISEEPLFCELLSTSVVILIKKIARLYCGNDTVKASRLIVQIREELCLMENWNTK